MAERLTVGGRHLSTSTSESTCGGVLSVLTNLRSWRRRSEYASLGSLVVYVLKPPTLGFLALSL